ncbi:MAG: hypothetical protein KDA81_11660 [Planctomycetaceae bacterium]|nr:hypothetical protein [Planctomycetaceae bacterium]
MEKSQSQRSRQSEQVVLVRWGFAAVFISSSFLTSSSIRADETDGAKTSLEGRSVLAESAENSQEQLPAAITFGSVDEARRHSVIQHQTYLAMLHVVHREYFDAEKRDILPALAMEDVFREIDHQTGGATRWIAVNTPAMNLDHEPREGFEKAAAKALSGGEAAFELIEGGQFHRAAAVPLQAGCIRCHLPSLSERRAGRVAALVMTLPIKSDEQR